MGLASPITDRLWALANYSASYAYPPLVTVSRSAIGSLFQQIKVGQLKLIDADGTTTICGQQKLRPDATAERSVYSIPVVELKVNKELFWVRLLLFADMGFSESYMLGEVSCSDLTAFFRLFILNREHLSNGSTITSNLASRLSYLLRKTNTLTTARLNIAAHYDISNEMFEAFLSRDMTYSCGIWLPKTHPKCKEETAQESQERKLRRFITNAKITKNDHVLEIGTGWGSFAILAVKETGCRVTSLTLSKEQKALAEERIAAAGFTDRIEVLLCDYRACPVPRETGCYDKVRYESYANSDDFIRRYIFPGGHLPSITQLLETARQGSKCALIPETVENIGPHYAKTLRIWNENFTANFDKRIRPALLADHRGMTEADVDLFKRKWEYYFTYCEAGFATKTLGDVIITFGREGAIQMMDDVPLQKCLFQNTAARRGFATVLDDTTAQKRYAAVVVGAGPAGITVLGNLLERKLGPVLWVDDGFNGGRVNRSYREVPSNTKTHLFVDFAQAVEPLKEIVHKTPSPNAIDTLRSLSPDKGCELSYAADMLLMLTEGLKEHPSVEPFQGRLNAATQHNANWTVSLSSPSSKTTQTALADRLVLCTGSSPTSRPLPTHNTIPDLDLDTALTPSLLSHLLPTSKPLTISVVGASHSAILALRNLSNLALSTHPDLRIKWFTRHALRYAEYMNNWILRDNTGLKGEAAVWARENLEPEVFPSSTIAKVVTVYDYKKDQEEETLARGLEGSDFVVQAIGFTRDPIPELRTRDAEGGKERGIVPVYDHLSGRFRLGGKDGAEVKGLFGAGIAWPERVTDPHGNVEYAVGFWKFMKYIKRVSPEWN
ncbi:hypothetical protein MBLNU457_1268t1 [Dothideomycetes sp. NU457]